MLKHVVLVQMISYLTAKDAPLWFVDTHAGAGVYSLESPFALKRGEFKDGIGRLWGGTGLPQVLSDYLIQIKKINPDRELRHYPGSPQIALQMLREQDRLQLFELHSTEGEFLQKQYEKVKRRVSVQPADGFAGLKSVLPPASRRALMLVDPSYEDKEDYRKVVAALRDALLRFATGVYAVWYPVIERQDAQDLPSQLRQLAGDADNDWLQVSLTVRAPEKGSLGLHGSGMFVFNPPWKLEASLQEAMPALVKLLGQDRKATFKLNFRQS